MAFNTESGRAYTIQDLQKLSTINAFGQYTGAIQGLIANHINLDKYAKAKTLEAESLKEQLLQLRKEVTEMQNNADKK